MSRLKRGAIFGGVAALVSTTLVAALILTHYTPAHAVTGAAFTTVNVTADGGNFCTNGNPGVNCNIYAGKQYVWLNGGPSVAYVGDGTYFFAVLDPGSQNDPNDASTGNLSSPHDTHLNRTFSVAGGTVAYTGYPPSETPHDFTSNKIRLMPYDDTTNPGGVYILAICSLANGYPVHASDCKYDAFKVQQGVPTVAPLTITKDAAGAYTDAFTWGIQKAVDRTEVVDSSGSATFNYTVTVTHDGGTTSDVKITGKITVTNPNLDSNNQIIPVNIDGVTDQLSDGTNCTVAPSGPQTLTQFNTDFTYVCDMGSSLPTTIPNNTATVTWPVQSLSIGQLDAGLAAFTVPGTDIVFTETKVNDCVDVTDTLGGHLGSVCSSDPSPTKFTYSHTVTGTPGTCVTQDNTATATTNTTKSTIMSSASVQLCTPADLAVTKNATPGFTRTYSWAIAKAADKSTVDPGGSVTYTVTVTQTGHTDSGWQTAGAITLANPNDFFDFTGVNVTDTVDDGGTCAVTGGTNVTVPRKSSVVLPYTCTYVSQPAYNTTATNTATATWDSTAFKTPDGTASGQATFAFNTGSAGNPTEINKCVTITDSYAGVLGSDCVGTDPPVKSFTYTRRFTPPASGCITVNNTATIVQTGQTASAAVQDCNSGALTMGFWQNKNGQGIIGAANQAALGTWLRQFHPFSDAPSSGLAAYTYTIIKAATCTSTTQTCNAMLRAQMLATALDVYFSDPALGGNKINAPTPIGGLTIDLTKICKMIDGSGGSAACSGTYENVSSAFGGAASMTVMNMLLYQNTADPAADAGLAWYSQVKATQVLAKDAFDAINNQVAVAP